MISMKLSFLSVLCAAFLVLDLSQAAAANAVDRYFSNTTSHGLDLKGFGVGYFGYTAKGWNYTDIDRRILEENLLVFEGTSKPYNASATDFIYVMPEHAFTTTEALSSRSLAVELAQRVPEPDPLIIPCIINSPAPDDLVVKRISCLARERYTFIVIGVLEKEPCTAGLDGCRVDGLQIFSTTVVFGKNGEIIAKYRKFHMIDEPALDAASFQERVTFVTESNVTIGVLTGHDFLYYEPAQALVDMGVKNFVYNGAWKNLNPFQFASSLQNGWVEANQVFLAAAGYQRAELGYTGHGHYGPRGYSIVVSHGSGGYVYTMLSVSEPIKSIQSEPNQSKQKSREIIMDSQDLREWTSVPVPFSLTPNEVKVCHGEKFCCILNYRMIRSADNPHYQLIAFDGNRTDSKGNVMYPEQTCGLAACSGDDVTTCGANKEDVMYTNEISFTELKLSGSFSSNKVVPHTMVGTEYYFPLGLLNYTVQNQDERYNVTYEYDRGGFMPVHTFALTSTDYQIISKAGGSRNLAALFTILLISSLSKLF